jgi:hypothetical protein
MSSFRSIAITGAAVLGYCVMVSFGPQIFFRGAVSAEDQSDFVRGNQAATNADRSSTSRSNDPAFCHGCLQAAFR